MRGTESRAAGSRRTVAVAATTISLACAGACSGAIAASRDAGRDDGGGDATQSDVELDSGVYAESSDSLQTADADAGTGETGSDGSDGDVAPPPSCAPGGPGMTNCGSGGDGGGTESCCTSLGVPGGSYYRTYTSTSDGGATGEADLAMVSGFRLDKYEVTVGRFRQFVAAWNGGSGWLPAAGSGKHVHVNGGLGLANAASPGTYEAGWNAADSVNVSPTDSHLACGGKEATWTPSPAQQENLPITCVNWYEAYAFCIWDGGFLPSEAEWELAAAGGDEQREYPWGAGDPGVDSAYAIYDCLYPDKTGDCTLPPRNDAPVGTTTAGVGRWGHLDLAGNAYEPTLDWSPLDYCQPYVDPCTDCAYLAGSSFRAIRGGNYYDGKSALVPASRGCNPPSDRGSALLGIRCARIP